MKESLEQFIKVINQLEETAEELTQLEEDKANAAANKNPKWLNEIVTQEQAALLKLRGLEQSRQQLSQALGWTDYSFRQILDAADPNHASRLLPAFDTLSHQLSLLTSSKERADRILTVRLHELKRTAAQMGMEYHTSEWRI